MSVMSGVLYVLFVYAFGLAGAWYAGSWRGGLGLPCALAAVSLLVVAGAASGVLVVF